MRRLRRKPPVSRYGVDECCPAKYYRNLGTALIELGDRGKRSRGRTQKRGKSTVRIQGARRAVLHRVAWGTSNLVLDSSSLDQDAHEVTRAY
ncbi:hypothetical protein NDU88_004789 [Pleurodeles waltl]|uniref:Uncharacterized protein n=1 Tax=Pleurodeles waltl TaxID=8319 RepID=A0AAV7TSZ8_PLEWA|nr:hypothetical protein NDU88_004789 [Pleurodeles waltl]